MQEVKLSAKNQIIVPREARNALGVKAGDKLLVVVRRGTVLLLSKPEKYSKAISGIAQHRYPPGYLEEERSAYDRIHFQRHSFQENSRIGCHPAEAGWLEGR